MISPKNRAASPRFDSFLVLLVTLSMLGPMTINILMPSLPGLSTALDTSIERAQLTLSLYLAGVSISQIALGFLADWFGRRPVILWALALYALASIIAALAPSIEILIVARVAQSFGGAAGITLGRTMIRDRYDQEAAARMIGYVAMAMVISPMLAPFIGAVLDETFSWRAIFWFCAAMGMAQFALAATKLPETRPEKLETQRLGDFFSRAFQLVRTQRFLLLTLAAGGSSGLFFGFVGAAPHLVIDVMGYSKTQYGMWFLALSVGYMLGNFLTGRLGARFGSQRLMLAGCYVGFIGAIAILLFALFLPPHPVFLFIPAMLFAFGNGLVLPNAIAAAMSVNLSAAGVASGVMGALQMGTGAVLSFITGALASHSAIPLGSLMVVCAIFSVIGGWACSKPEQ